MFVFFFFKQKTAYELRISDWSSDVCSSDLLPDALQRRLAAALGDGVFNIPGTRRQFRVASRVALVSRGRPGAGGSLGLDPGLAALLKGWTLSPPPPRDRVDDLSAVLEALAAIDTASGRGEEGTCE